MALWMLAGLKFCILFVWVDAECALSLTTVNGASTCSKTAIFEENFNTLNKNIWKYTRRISSELGQEFVVYEEKPEIINVDNGILTIKPTKFDEIFVQTGSISIGKCTGIVWECSRIASGYNIIPPVQSAQIKTKMLNFRYGTVEIRAKLPAGDWIVPQIWLEPTHIEYGSRSNSGKIIIAKSFGNDVLTTRNGENKSNKILQTGVVFGIGNKVKGVSAFWEGRNSWSSEFHTYKFTWTPDQLTFSVDDNQRSIIPDVNRTLFRQADFTQEEGASIWQNESNIAPFDKEFHITLGLSVGGINEFPNGSTSGNYAKPWSDSDPKAMLKFWQAKEKWFPTWLGQDASLQIDYIKVFSL